MFGNCADGNIEANKTKETNKTKQRNSVKSSSEDKSNTDDNTSGKVNNSEKGSKGKFVEGKKNNNSQNDFEEDDFQKSQEEEPESGNANKNKDSGDQISDSVEFDNFAELSQTEKEELFLEIKDEKKKLKKEVESREEEVNSLRKKIQRLQADFDNYRRRTQKEKDGLGLKAQIELLEEILPVLDNFERALKTSEVESEFKDGIKLIFKQLYNTLKQKGLEKIECENLEFDPRYHEAIMQVEDCKAESGIVIEELQKGYMFNGKVIRPAMVKVAE